MLSVVCAEIRNWFTYDCDKHIGDFEIMGGVITPSFDFKTDYIRIVGSRKNDGVYKVSDIANLVDEKFHGAIWEMSIPNDFLSLCEEIAAWQEKFGGVDSVAMSPFSSESFGGYSYQKAVGYNKTGESEVYPSWKSVYAKRLSIYRKI